MIEVLELAKRFKKLVAVDGVSFTCHDGEVFGLLVERAGLYARFTPREHLHFYGRLHGLDGPKLEQRVSTVLEMLEIADFADRRAEGFSAGMNRRVILGQALIHNPPNVILWMSPPPAWA